MTQTEIEVPKWSAKEFEQQVLECNPRVAVFDCDGTLWSGDSGYGFMVWSIEQGLVSRSTSDWIDNRHRAEMSGLIEQLHGRDVELWAVSSTNRWVVAEGVRAFGIPEERVLAAEVRVAAGHITSELTDVPTDEGKAASLKRVGLPRPDAVFGNSIHDVAMLEIAVRAFPVNPSPALLEAAARHGWGYFRPAAAEGIDAAVEGE